MKTQEIIDNGDDTISLRTVDEDTIPITSEDVVQMDLAKQQEIALVENSIRVLQAQLADLQAEQAITADLSARSVELKPVKVPAGGGIFKVG